MRLREVSVIGAGQASPEETARPAEGEVLLWRASLDAAPAEALFATLSPDEHERAGRYRFARDRHRFVAGRGLLRRILAGALGISPSEVRFAYGAYGKPMAEGEPAHGIRFNVSHSGGLFVCAVAAGREVGVDVERIRPDLADEAIARQFFSPSEVAELLATPSERRTEAFLRCWTRKEAYVKATGLGLSLPLDSFDVSLHPEEPAAPLRTRPDPSETGRWILVDLPCPAGYLAALAVARRATNRPPR